MGEVVSPNPTQRQRLPRVQSPTTPFTLCSNDDKLERAQSRAARAAAIRLKPVVANPRLSPLPSDPCLNKQQILDLFQNCIKLASENKINQKNTWDLSLIDHLGEIIKAEEETDTETNFQKASCSLEAGVKIYSLRVDSVHSEAYKVLGGINRSGLEGEPDNCVVNENVENGQEEHHPKKEQEKKISPLSTLEPNFTSLNAKKFDVAFAVDPLYHQTSAQFDEGGAKGLLLNNLGVFGRCRVLFDSQEVPGKLQTEKSSVANETVDLSFARDAIEQMVRNMRKTDEISPTLQIIISHFDDDNKRPLNTYTSFQTTSNSFEEPAKEFNVEVEHQFDDCVDESLPFGNDDRSVVEDELHGEEATISNFYEEIESFDAQNSDANAVSEDLDDYLLLSLGFRAKHNAWAGPEHWKYRRPKDSEENASMQEGSPVTTKKKTKKKAFENDINFLKALDDEVSNDFSPPKNAKTLLLATKKETCCTKLPEDCHYQPESLVKLFLLPDTMCLGKRLRKCSDTSQQYCDFEPDTSWDNESGIGGYQDDENSFVDEANNLVDRPRQVTRIDVQYDKTSKQVDVQILKETLWDHMQESSPLPVQEKGKALSFKDLLATFPDDCSAASTISDISPHLCFICLLHLANEHGLNIHGCATLDDLVIHRSSNDSRPNVVP